jgi:hypothetical protein
VLGQPEPLVAPAFDMACEIDGVLECLGRVGVLYDVCEVENGERYHGNVLPYAVTDGTAQI